MKHIVTSLDGVQFVVESDARTVPYDRARAAVSTATELEAHGDFTRLHDIGQLVPSYADTPRIAGPAERRAAFQLIQGGKS